MKDQLQLLAWILGAILLVWFLVDKPTPQELQHEHDVIQQIRLDDLDAEQQQINDARRRLAQP